MTVRKVELERSSVTSAKPFHAVVAALKSAIGQPDMAAFAKANRSARSFAELEDSVHKALGRTG
jgi:hypothetical protein